jgi:hypothetical protein
MLAGDGENTVCRFGLFMDDTILLNSLEVLMPAEVVNPMCLANP